MKGIVFTEFIDMVDARFGANEVDCMLETAAPANGGAYTAVGTYDHRELLHMVVALAKRLGRSPAEVLQAFGRHLAGRFRHHYPQFFAAEPDLFGFLASVDSHIHVEVRKLYPEAQLPSFVVEQRDATRLALRYRSPRCLGDLAHGLIEGCAALYGDRVAVRCEPVDGDATVVRFVVERAA